ncbi:hypothetical protein HUB98_04430 [Paenibacillus barcinonensis]|uniref:Uncharacterized protein n=1 Tax=Paenibacillus barcinonensis TaxID=198119 RepID=A0A2V4VCI3_PAEBA|nr:hypothetical protein [Paenibacillus barcinonensis]PYE51228.1 hypothetical protein DFQ00_10219 [Paenibacillus barcinonensis]QKS55638.1 hypothetical protein HUB98_04430 [Paenibacillus barcinonensis]
MEREEAVFLLKCHAFACDDVTHPKVEQGFLGSLRPFRGHLIEENFHELMSILRVLARELARPMLDREVMACLWSIPHLARAWAIEPAGMLRSNHLISDEQVVVMEQWLSMFSYAVMILVEDGGEQEAFWEYEQYVQKRGNTEGEGV